MNTKQAPTSKPTQSSTNQPNNRKKILNNQQVLTSSQKN
jgi:hypothetical protein